MNNCVGQRNYRFFMGFTTSVCCLAILVLPCLLWAVVQGRDESSGSGEMLEITPVILYILICVACLAGLAALLLFSLWIYHLFLISQGKTTSEHLKGKRQMDGLADEPTLCAPRGPQLFNQFGWVDSAVVLNVAELAESA